MTHPFGKQQCSLEALTGKYLVIHLIALATELKQASAENDNVNSLSLHFYILHALSCLE